VIGDDGDWMSGTLKILLPFRQSEDNSKKFLIVNIVVSFGSNECFGKVCTRVEVSVNIFLK
jgi:hypothetical protein